MALLDRLQGHLRAPAWVRTVANLFGHRRRRRWHDGARAHVELRAVPAAEFPAFATALEATLLAFEGVRWVWVNGLLGRVIIGYDQARTGVDELTAIVDVVEVRLGYGDLPFAEVIPDYPADIEPLARKAVDLGADALGAILGTALKIYGFSPSRAGFDVAALMTVLDNTPRLRQLLVDRLGGPAVEVGLGVTNAFVQAVGAGPIGPLVDMFAQVVKLRAEVARRHAWQRREAELCGEPGDHHPSPLPPRQRPVPVPEGIIDRYADDALFASLGGFIVGIADTHNLEAATAPLFGGLPKAALYGRTLFAYEVMRILGQRGAIILRSSATRLLDRVDSLLITEEALVDESRAIARIAPAPEIPRERAVHHAGMLFDPVLWEQVHEHEGWRLGPPERLALSGVDGPLAFELAHAPGPCLLLLEGATPRAVVHLRPALRRGAEALLATARRARLHLVLATDTPALARALAVHQQVAADAAHSAVLDLQREGRVVAIIASDAPTALAAADVGIGLTHDPRRPPWTADIMLKGDLADAIFLVDAIATARDVADQSVVLAGVGAALGGVLALGGLKRTKPTQVMLATHAAAVIAGGNGLRRAVALARRPPPPQQDPTPWHRLPADAVLERLGATLDAGLSEARAAERLRLPPRPPGRPLRLARAVFQELQSPLTPVLLTGAALSAVSGSIADAALIAGVFALNGAIGGVERYRAEEEIAALERRERPAVRVRRDGQPRTIPAEALVPGDLVELLAGEVVPADCRIITADGLEIDESSLTGESLPIPKDAAPSYAPAIAERTSMLYEGTAVAVGQVRALVVATGADTESRRGGLSLLEQAPETGVEARLRKLTEMTLPVAGLSGALLMGAGLFRGQDINRLVDLGVSMTVAAVPEGLPLLATVAQLAAARRLSQRGALVRNPRMVEALGRVDVLCADKTGTLTEGKITLHAVADGRRVARTGGDPPEPWARLLLAAALRASPEPPKGGVLPHPTDRAVVDGALRLGVATDEGRPGWVRMHELPFEPGRGYHGSLGRTARGLWISVKGAPEVLLPRCTRRADDGEVEPVGPAEREAILAAAERLAGEGLRVLAIAEREASEERDLDDARIGKLVFIGFVTLADPPRATAAQAITRLHAAGIDVLMITGDHPRTAKRIADELGLLGGKGVLTGPELEAMSDDELDRVLPGVAVIARATPAHKVRIVKAQQRAGRVVAMTGDGANDASAIRLADVGIALGEQSTVAARDAAGLIVVDERIETIVDAIAEGRAMWSSVRDAVAILTGGNLGEIGFSVIAGLLGGESPLNARQLLLVNLLTDVAPAMTIALRPPSEAALAGLLAEGPEAALGESLDRQIALRAITTAAGAGAAWIASNLLPGGRQGNATVALLSLVATQLGQTLVAGKPTREILAASLGSFAALLAIVETPGVSHVFGCTPVGPAGLALAFSTSALATGASVVALPAYEAARRLARRLKSARRPEPTIDVEVLTERPVARPPVTDPIVDAPEPAAGATPPGPALR